MNIIEPTESEKANGWTTESLSKYIDDREKARLKVVSDPSGPPRPTEQNSKYNPHRIWRQ